MYYDSVVLKVYISWFWSLNRFLLCWVCLFTLFIQPFVTLKKILSTYDIIMIDQHVVQNTYLAQYLSLVSLQLH